MLDKIKQLFGISNNQAENVPKQTSVQNVNTPRQPVKKDNEFNDAMQRVVAMPHNAEFGNRVRNLGLNVLNVMWEDTARTAGSAWGANISDMTLQVRYPDSAQRKELLPVIRYPNFTDKTGDIPLEFVKLKVGNEKDKDLKVITLREYLMDLNKYISHPKKFHRENQPLIDRKSVV